MKCEIYNHCIGLQASSATHQLIHGLPPPTPPPTTVGSSVAQALNAVEHIEEVSASDKADKAVAVVVEDEDEAGNTSDEGYRTHSSGMATAAAGN